MRANDQVKNCVAFLATDRFKPDGTVAKQMRGTAFFVVHRYGPSDFQFLITARHVIDRVKELGCERMYIRANRKGGGFDYTEVDPRRWRNHPADDDGDGLRTSRTLGGSTVSYRWDVASGLPQVLQDSASSTYVYGLDLISRTDGGGNQEYHLTDGLGSTTGLADGTGSVTDTYGYDVYGAVRARTGTSGQEFTFTGEQVDGSGLQYLRARYYDAATGRFASRDPLPFVQRYAYVGGNPVNLADPTGEFPCPGCGKVKDALGSAASATVSAVGAVAENPYVQQCVVWGGVGAAFGGGVQGAAIGCATGIASTALERHVTSGPASQCTVWSVGAAGLSLALKKPAVARAGIGGCVAGALSWFDNRYGFGNELSQCGAWAAPAWRFTLGSALARYEAAMVACAGGGLSKWLSYE